MSVIKSFIFITLFTILQNIDAQDQIDAVQFIDHPQKNEYILQSHGTDKHKYGYELKENKHFHHTTTELDGVRLGCYGHVLEGKKYSTQYVADIKGYRPVYTYNVINVYPKSGGVREATFIGNFNEDKDKSENIRYFFPEGCRGDDSNIIIPAEKNPMPPPVIRVVEPSPRPTPTPAPTTPKTTPKPPTQPPPTPRRTIEQSVPVINVVKLDPETTTKKPTPPPETYLPPPNTYLPPVVTPAPSLKGNYITKAIPPQTQPKLIPTTRQPKADIPAPKAAPKVEPKPAPKAEPKPSPPKPAPKVEPKPAPPKAAPKVEPKPTPALFKKPIVVAPIPEEPKNSCEVKTCCNDDESVPKLVIPINLGVAKDGSCPRFAKLVVPADSVGMESLKTLLSNPSELAKTIIKSLS
ncbi:uncharacterized protein [Chironomus tepperi]|uniref:uncharacterized protein isoform X1 n=1 Tax=Chironomus tepperi TaxID=113505 RepID=UPI00391F736E